MLLVSRIVDALQIFKQDKLMSTFTLMGIIIGVAACAIFLRLEEISKFNYQKTIEALGEDEFVATLLPFRQLDSSDIDYVQWQTFLEQHPGNNLLPYSQFNISDTMILAVSPDVFKKITFTLVSGRTLTELDRFSNVAIVGRQHEMANRLGDSFLIKDDWIKVIGVFDALTPPLLELNLNQSVLVHLALPERLGWSNTIDMVWGRGDKTEFKAYFELYFKGYGLHIRDSAFYLQQFSAQMGSYQRIFLQISILALFLGMLSFSNLRLLSLQKRQQEIGIRMAVGAHPFDIAWLFQIESAVLGVAGGLIGVLLSEGVTCFIISDLHWYYHITIWPYVLAVGLAVILSLLAGLYPAIQAARLKPSYLLTTY